VGAASLVVSMPLIVRCRTYAGSAVPG
jgi:hypothetical protein